VRPLKTLAVGMSVSATCGVRAHAGLLAQALGGEEVSCSLHWLSRGEDSLPSARSEVLAWTRELAVELDGANIDAILLHYSVFAWSYRGLPFFVHPTLAVLRRSGIPVISVMHELVYPWRIGGLRGKVWALSQRALLIEVMRASSAVVATADFRIDWLASRRWLPKREAALAPVFSNLPVPTLEQRRQRRGGVVGLFGYSYEGAAVSLVLDALALLVAQGVEVQLVLLGAPGRSSAAAREWLARASERGVERALSFSGSLPAQELSNALAECDVLLFVGAHGPSSRKGTLAGSLASGRPVVALDGPRRWSELTQAEAVYVVKPSPAALAEGVRALLADEGLREALGARGRAFAQERMGVARTAKALRMLLDGIVAQPTAS
jgi:glycosyltransferase involved in cell wall biosynthesis